MVYALIPARGGSKAIPNKNIVNVNGNPLIYYTIKALQDSNVDKIFVSTDSTEIADVALSMQVNVIERPSDISSDSSQSEEALLHFAKIHKFNTLVFVQATSPLLESNDINKGLKMLDTYDSVFSGCKQHWTPKWKEEDEPFSFILAPYHWDIYDRPMRQEKHALYEENGAFYITSRKLLLENKLRYSGSIGIFEMPQLRSFQIDEPEDIPLIEHLLRR